MKNPNSYTANTVSWKGLYKAAAIAAIIVAILIPVQGAIFAIWPPPLTVVDWFALFQKNKLIGLLDMDLLLMVDYILFLLIFLALWAALKRTNPSLVTIAVTFQLIGIAAYFASAGAFEMLRLSNQYAMATTIIERTLCLAAGETVYAHWQGTAFMISYFLGFIALLCISVVMLQSSIFNRATAYFGLIAGILMVVPPTAGRVGMVLSFLSLVPTIPWLLLIAKRFFKLNRIYERKTTPNQTERLQTAG